MIRRVAGAAVILALLGLGACASASRPEAMTLSATPGLIAGAGDVGYHSVTSVTVAGGTETNPLWVSSVSNDDFRTALEASLDAAGYLGTSGSPLAVSANLEKLQQPIAGLDMSVTSTVRYSVTREGTVVFDDTVAATGTATMGEALAAVERLRLANEKSIRENIRQFLERFRDHVAH